MTYIVYSVYTVVCSVNYNKVIWMCINSLILYNNITPKLNKYLLIGR